MSTDTNAPARHLSIIDAICVVVAIVVGSMIFKAPSWVASNTSGPLEMMLAWIAGGFFCLCGALCYAELATAYPKIGGEYVYITRAFGRPAGFGFVWARATVIQTGSIAMLAYVFGDYAAGALKMGSSGPMILALVATVVLTVLNVIGLRPEKWILNTLTIVKIVGVLGIAAVGLLAPASVAADPTTAPAGGNPGAIGLAMVLVLLTFGGWNESAYVAGELKGPRRNMLWVMVGSIVLITVIYLLINMAYLRVLGFEGMRQHYNTLAADAMTRVLGSWGGAAVTILVAVSVLGAMDGCMFTGSRAICALGEDYAAFRPLGRWHGTFRTPANALIIQSAIAIVLIILPSLGWGIGELVGSGFRAAADYTFPVFWIFLLLTGVAVIVLRDKDPDRERPFRVPGYPFTVIIFVNMCGYMLYSSIAYTGTGALIGLAVLLAGLPVYLAFGRKPANA
ncbi:MAG: amino acid permease [Phycisphaerae bacterium]|jgi:amino acid transporter|nr:amino acid permease [Phycisphaerae bacterium]